MFVFLFVFGTHCLLPQCTFAFLFSHLSPPSVKVLRKQLDFCTCLIHRQSRAQWAYGNEWKIWKEKKNQNPDMICVPYTRDTWRNIYRIYCQCILNLLLKSRTNNPKILHQRQTFGRKYAVTVFTPIHAAVPRNLKTIIKEKPCRT